MSLLMAMFLYSAPLNSVGPTAPAPAEFKAPRCRVLQARATQPGTVVIAKDCFGIYGYVVVLFPSKAAMVTIKRGSLKLTIMTRTLVTAATWVIWTYFKRSYQLYYSKSIRVKKHTGLIYILW